MPPRGGSCSRNPSTGCFKAGVPAAPPRDLSVNNLTVPGAEVGASVLEVTVEPGLGTSIDVVLTGGTLCEGDTIVLGGLHGAITTRVRPWGVLHAKNKIADMPNYPVFST